VVARSQVDVEGSRPMQLPNVSAAIVDRAKLTDYGLNPEHPRGRHKARVFAAVLGLGPADADTLQRALIEAAQDYEAVPTGANAFGELYTIDSRCRDLAGELRSVATGLYLAVRNAPAL